MRQANIFYRDKIAGVLTETDESEYIYQYDDSYIEDHSEEFITFTMPVRKEPYVEKRLFSFFEGLIPEGWLLDIAARNWKINRNDRMGLLLACCQNCIGAVSVQPIVEGNGE
ncbi:HipA N-terminal domain-containing protein [Gillisia limnaea]|uniref:HipA N-terminal domain protein n=1 Tax=Gillisia limnaea (strain DSM 15749 / LMG 21470 / R-8282) TaxID=865937 RepID=H2BW68_GILLR|nr:HipA N-terminal domain-containing protein [Gillisia limnaea]EHQ04032.1 HipA N-terminal domain protein [Gillisia limnaea DSM 15749]